MNNLILWSCVNGTCLIQTDFGIIWVLIGGVSMFLIILYVVLKTLIIFINIDKD